MPATIHIDDASGGDEVPDESTMRGWILAALPPQRRDDVELSVRIVDDAEMTALNGRHRGKHGPTNVLSFPADLPAGVDLPLLGDIVVCAPVVVAEAADQGKGLDAHWAHMLVHGTLHLQGYDHDEEAAAEAMEVLETEIITGLGFPPPYGAEPAALQGANR